MSKTLVLLGGRYEVVKPFGEYFNKKGDILKACMYGELYLERTDRTGFCYDSSRMAKYIDLGYLKLLN
jgi:hypothetical protein